MSTSDFKDFEYELRNYMKELRIKSGATQVDFVKRGDSLNQSTLTKFESGQSPNITLKSIYEMAKAASVPLSDIIRKAEKNEMPFDEEKWDEVFQDIAKLPEEKQKWLARVLREVLRGSLYTS